MKNKTIQAIGLGFAFSTIAASGNTGDWASNWKNLGLLYKDKTNPIVQEVKVFGRAHYQFGYSDVSDDSIANGEYSGSGDELRRLRFGASIKFLNGFKAVGRVNLEDGGFRRTNLDYDGFDELYLQYGTKDILIFDKASVGYGRYKVAFGGEENTSSKKIKTVERSNLNNIFAPDRATGVMFNGESNGKDFKFGVLSTRSDDETWAKWDGGIAYFASAEMESCGGNLRGDLIYVDAEGNEDEVFGYDWAASLTYTAEIGDWDFFANATYGDLGADEVYGVVIMPSTYLVEDKLEAVFRYQWAHSTGQNIRPNSRNLRNVARSESPGRNIARGDDNHTFYAGLNYYLNDNYAKVMVGAEYETLEGDTADLRATTLWAAFRMYF